MNIATAPPPVETREISALIESLHHAERRLEQLTAGEVDAVADSEGRTFLLRRAQEALQHRETEKQAAILNTLEAHIALLDAQGVILAVNDSWRRFSCLNGVAGSSCGVGLNYLITCDESSSDRASVARQEAEGIRSVLSGAAASYSLEYPCHSTTEQRWFVVTVRPMARDRPEGVVVMHTDVTAARCARDILGASELRFRQLAENIRDMFILQHTDGSRVEYVSPAYETIWGRTCESLYADPMSWIASVHPDDLDDVRSTMRKAGDGEFDGEYRIIRPDGTVRWVHARTFPVRGDTHGPHRTVGIATDITARKESEHKIIRLSRLYAVSSEINALIARAQDRGELFQEACRIAVQIGEFTMAWIGVLDPQNIDGSVVAWCGGDESFADDIHLTARTGTLNSDRPASRALRHGRPVICNNIAADPSMRRLSGEMLTRGYKSVASFPLLVTTRPVAVITFFAAFIDVFDEQETRLLTELARDISFALDHLEKSAQLIRLGSYDPLTNLANQRLFLERATRYLGEAESAGHKAALCLFDLERFKKINDTFGQAAGDSLLKQVAAWLTQEFKDINLVARVGPDKFAVLMPNVMSGEDVTRQIEATMNRFMEHPFELADGAFRIAAKVGAALFPDDGADTVTTFAKAEAALKRAKARGERHALYAQAMTETVAGRLTMDFQLRHALDNHEFVLHYQPKVNLASGAITGAEALIRWNDPRTGLVPPAKFIPILEETGLILDVGRWAMSKAVSDYLSWQKAGLPAVPIAVNVSALQLRNDDFAAAVAEATGVDTGAAAGLQLEITESVIMDDIDRNISILQAIRALGVSLAIDDFGTGFSSLSYLTKLPLDTIKIDRSFVVQMTGTPAGRALVTAIIDLAHSLKLNVVAEGVETEEQFQLLCKLGCNEMQGWLFSKAVPLEQFSQMLSSRKRMETPGCLESTGQAWMGRIS